MIKRITIFLGLLLSTFTLYSQDPNFHIYLCFGQSNMEGQGTIESQDKVVDPRFQVMEAVNCSNMGRTKGKWYPAIPPLTRCYSGLSPADYFGRTMVDNLPDSIKVGIINVSVAGCKIELFQKTAYQTYVSSITEAWLKNIINEYTGNPYAYLIDLAKQAQNNGIIKGILLHQGESNTGDSQWPAKVKSIYNDLMADLSLNPSEVPLLAGEVVNADQGGVCASMNTIIARLPQSITNSYVISSAGCTDAPDNLHFNSAGYREIGKRYANQMLKLMGIEVAEPEDPETPIGTIANYYEPECATIGENWLTLEDADASNGSYVTVKPGTQSLNEAASGSEGLITIPFTVDSDGSFTLYARLDCASYDDDSYWIKVDNGDYQMYNGLATTGWQWMNLNSFTLTAGDHVLTISYREDGAKLDKICISNFTSAPSGLGDEAINICENNTPTGENDENKSPSFQTYMNPVIPGDHPDCTVTKIGNDFYTTGSSFNVTPVIYHSTDLVHWEAIAQPVSATWSGYGDTPGGGCWGGQMVLHNGQYWHYFSRGNTMHFTTADQPEGPWSMPTKVNNPSQLSYGLGYDNSIFIDDDGKWYLVVKNGQPNGAIVELGNNGQATGVVYDLKWLNPSPALPYSWAEGPVMWKYNGYYYYSFAHDLSGGQKVMRSRTLTAEESAWEMLGDFFNESDPKKGTSLFTSPNHASQAVMLDDSTSWIIHPIYAAGEWRGQGRQGLLNQVRYDANDKPTADYPINASFTAPKLPNGNIPWMVPRSDFFDSENLNPEWCYLGQTAASKTSLTDRQGWLRLSPKTTTKPNTLIKNDGEHNYSLITRIDFKPSSTKDQAGLWIMRGDETMEVKLVSTASNDGSKIVAFSFENTRYELPNTIGDTIWLKLIRVNHQISAYFGSEGNDWVQLGKEFNVSKIDSYSDFSSFTGTRQGLYVVGTKAAFFDLYIYRDAFTPILAECPANQLGTSRSSLRNGIRQLDNIHNNDWALYAGVEFGDGSYYDLPDSIEFTASGNTTGGMIEVWLDSIDTGTKLTECSITPTGSLSVFKTFTAGAGNVTGRHDVYLKFTGSGTDKLFQLQWMKFTRASDKQTSADLTELNNEVSLFPNPAHEQLTFKSGEAIHLLEIFNMSGQKSFRQEFAQAVRETTVNLNLAKGSYIVQLHYKSGRQQLKLIIE